MTLKDEGRENRRITQSQELYRSIGEFAVAFEQMNGALWNCAMWLLAMAGLRDQGVAQIVLAKLTADPLRDLVRSLIGHIRSPNPDEEKIISDLFNRHLALTQKRNDYLHGEWFIGWGNADTTDWSIAHGHKLDRNKSGPNVKAFKFTAADFDELTKEARELEKLFFRLSACYTGERAVEKNFEFASDGRVVALGKSRNS